MGVWGGGDRGVLFLVSINSVKKIWLLLNKILCPIAWRLYSLFHVPMVLVVFPCCVQLAHVSYILNRESSRLQRHAVVQLTDHSCLLYVCNCIYIYIYMYPCSVFEDLLWFFFLLLQHKWVLGMSEWLTPSSPVGLTVHTFTHLMFHQWFEKMASADFFGTNFSRRSAVHYNVFFFGSAMTIRNWKWFTCLFRHSGVLNKNLYFRCNGKSFRCWLTCAIFILVIKKQACRVMPLPWSNSISISIFWNWS